MKNKEKTKGFIADEAGDQVASQKNDSIGLDRKKLRGSEVEELTLS